jgi:hypothetical protein
VDEEAISALVMRDSTRAIDLYVFARSFLLLVNCVDGPLLPKHGFSRDDEGGSFNVNLRKQCQYHANLS